MKPTLVVSNDAKKVSDDVALAKMRMIYEDPAAYADWRIRVGMDKPIEGRDNPVMRARVAKLFRELGASMEPPRSKSRPGYQPVESLAEYGRQPLAVSDAFKATLRRPEAAE